MSSPALLSLLFQGIEAQLSAVCRSGESASAELERLPVPIYVTDAEGGVVAWNGAAAAFAGREPTRDDRWCVTWKLRTVDGAPLAHAECPMARALRSGEPVREAVALAERPDGSLVPFTPFPTPLKDHAGRLAGGFNLLLDVSDPVAAIDALLTARESLSAADVAWDN